MDELYSVSGLYIPFCIEKAGASQPISTALSHDAGKNLCLNHFLSVFRTLKQRLAPGQGAEIASVRIDALSLEWNLTSTGIYEGRPAGCPEALMAQISNATYQLRPTG